MKKIKVASWNIAGGRTIKSGEMFDYNNEDLGYFVNQLEIIKADVICLQETHSNDNYSIAHILAEKLDLPNVFLSPLSFSHIDSNFELGLAIISRYAFRKTTINVITQHKFKLYWKDGKKARDDAYKGIQIATIENFSIANTQLLPLEPFGLSYEDGEGKEWSKEVDQCLSIVKAPAIFCGDFNTNDPIKVFPEFASLSGFREALPEKITRPEKNGTKYNPDHILYSSELKLSDSDVVVTNTDHYLCWADFEVNIK